MAKLILENYINPESKVDYHSDLSDHGYKLDTDDSTDGYKIYKHSSGSQVHVITDAPHNYSWAYYSKTNKSTDKPSYQGNLSKLGTSLKTIHKK